MDELTPAGVPVALPETPVPTAPFTPQPLYTTPAAPVAVSSLASLGPWWHTLGIALLLLVYALVAHVSHTSGTAAKAAADAARDATGAAKAIPESSRVPLYCSQVLLSWMLLSTVVCGVYHRRAFFLSTLRRRTRAWLVDPAIGLAIYFGFFTLTITVVMLLTAVLMVRHRHDHPRHASVAQGSVSAPAPAGKGEAATSAPSSTTKDQAAKDKAADMAASMKDTQERVQRLLHFDRDAVASLAPRTAPELLMWVLVSFTAGFCEEHIFRGYLLGQAMVVMRRYALPPWLGSTLAVVLTSMLFGSLHLYEGIGGAVLVTVLGAVFATMALLLGNLRAVIVAHFLQDMVAGLTYYVAHSKHVM